LLLRPVDPQKCQVMGAAKAPLKCGHRQFPACYAYRNYATADIIAYDGVRRVKVGASSFD
jgi:hypothetical protein